MRALLANGLFALSIFGFAGAGLALDGDSSANAPEGFDQVLDATKGVVLKVPVNEKGEENTDAIEVRFYQGDDEVSTSTDLSNVWEESQPVAMNEVITGENQPTTGDSSTARYYWYNYGWRSPGYYWGYYPSYYYNYRYWNYRPYTYSYFPRYRYYYYNYWY